MSSVKEWLINMMYPVYGFRVKEEQEDTPSRQIKKRDLTEAFVGQTSAHGPPHIYGARGETTGYASIFFLFLYKNIM